MSYRYPNTGDSTQDMFINLTNFYNILPNLKKAKDPEVFFRWFEKLDYIDRRSLYLNLTTGQIDVPDKYKRYVYRKYKDFRGSERLAEVIGYTVTPED